jgi:hypothetical protein
MYSNCFLPGADLRNLILSINSQIYKTKFLTMDMMIWLKTKIYNCVYAPA